MAFTSWKNFRLNFRIDTIFIKLFKLKAIIILSFSFLFFFACEDKDEKDRPKELVGTWYVHEMNSQLKMTSSIDQVGRDPFSKGISSLSVKGGASDILLEYMMPQFDPSTGETGILITNQPIFDQSQDQTFPMAMLMLGENDLGEKQIMMQVAYSENSAGIYMNASNYSFNEQDHSISINNETLYSVNIITGEIDKSDFLTINGSFKPKSIQLSKNISATFPFPLFDFTSESQDSWKLEENGNATLTSVDLDDGQTDNEDGEWYVVEDTLFIIVKGIDDYDQSEYLDIIVLKYELNGSNLLLSREASVCEIFDEEDPDDYDPSDGNCIPQFEMMFGLKINSLSELNMFQQVKLNQTPHSALNLKSMKKFDVDQLMDQFRKLRLK